MLSRGLVSLFSYVDFHGETWVDDKNFFLINCKPFFRSTFRILSWMRLQSTGDQKVFYCFCSFRMFSPKTCKRNKNCLYIQSWAKFASKIADFNNRTGQHTSSALGWSPIASVKTLNTTKIKPTVTFLLEAGGTSLVAYMKKGVRVGGKVTRGWSEPCCEWWLHFPGGVFVGGRGELRLNSSKKQKTKTKNTSRFCRWHGEGAETDWATGDHRSWLAGWLVESWRM